MSRGPGRVQRFVLDLLARSHKPAALDCWVTVEDVAQELAEGRPSRAQTEAVRRAMKQLARAGRIELDLVDVETRVRSARVDRGEFYAHRARHTSTRTVLAAHCPLSVEEKEVREQYERRLDALVRLDQRIGQLGRSA